MKIAAAHAPVIAKSTIASNMPTLPSGSKLSCTITAGDATNPTFIDCSNVGALGASTYWFALSI